MYCISKTLFNTVCVKLNDTFHIVCGLKKCFVLFFPGDDRRPILHIGQPVGSVGYTNAKYINVSLIVLV